MSVTAPATAELRDPDIPAVSELLRAEGVPGPVAAAFGDAGATVESAVARQVTWWPGSSILVKYSAELTGAIEGRHEVVAAAGRIPDGAVVVEADGERVGVWTVPHDPALPGLAAALDPVVVGALLAEFGRRVGGIELRVRAYRPTRRAVVEVRDSGGVPLYLKVVRPRDVERLHAAHQALAAHLPVPRSLGVDRERGIVALERLPGATLREALDDPDAALPAPGDLDDLLRSMPRFPDAGSSKSPIERVPKLAGLLSAILPGEAARIEHLLAAIGTDEAPPTIPVHGDFYEAQLLISGGRVTGLLDIDTVGLGRPGDDPATMLGHLASWRGSARHPERVTTLANGLLRHWDLRVDPVDVRLRAAAVLVGLATGPFRVQRPTWPADVAARLDLAQRWVESSNRVGERALTDTSGSSHPAARS